MDVSKLKDIQLDALKEVANIGACHAATALSELTGEKVMVNVPVIRINPIEEVFSLVAKPNEVVASVLIYFLGDMTGRTLLLFPQEAAWHLTDCLMRQPLGTTKKFGELEESALKELSNVLTCAYMNSLGDLLGLVVVPSVPSMAVDMASAVLETVSLEFSSDKDMVVCIETEFRFVEKNTTLYGYFLLLPDPASLEVILKAIHLG
ncbi:chemotaxis protein CheC [candidate division TA06 bacterium]|uniref:Chemotaxis protein CheC n=1 Tax=candidate division TA06 bacterium TaxID=2250710 RepID=A0A933MJT2_UNCT6|nr:chemotaxis protein CheC [candidate division TA06 bacterium]